MEEQLVSYETAVLAGNKGCYKGYTTLTQSFLQKWLYEKYGLWCSVKQIEKEDLIDDEILFIGEIQNNSVQLDSVGDVDPDKCWEKILKKALNLL